MRACGFLTVKDLRKSIISPDEPKASETPSVTRRITSSFSKIVDATDGFRSSIIPRGRVFPSTILIPLSLIIKLADYYNTSIDYLTGRTDNPEINK